MVVLALVSVPISLLNVANKLDVLTLLSDAQYLQAFGRVHLDALVMLSLGAHVNAMRVAEVFWRLWLLRVRHDPLHDLRRDHARQHRDLPSALGEIGTCLWLLVMGIADPKRATALSRPPD